MAARQDPADVADRLHSAAIRLLRSAAREDARSGLTPARLSALSVVVYGGPLTLGALAAAERVAASTMSNTVAGLVADGLVRRQAVPGDARAVEVRATAKGRRMLAAARRRRVAAIAARLTALPSAELATVARAAAVLERALDESPVRRR